MALPQQNNFIVRKMGSAEMTLFFLFPVKMWTLSFLLERAHSRQFQQASSFHLENPTFEAMKANITSQVRSSDEITTKQLYLIFYIVL